jgi:hypothetical protein
MGADELTKSLNVIDKYFKARAGKQTTATPGKKTVKFSDL